MKTKITNENLVPFLGQTVSLATNLGCMFSLTGKLVKDFGFCWYGLDIGNGNVIGFSFGQFSISETAQGSMVHIYIN